MRCKTNFEIDLFDLTERLVSCKVVSVICENESYTLMKMLNSSVK